MKKALPLLFILLTIQNINSQTKYENLTNSVLSVDFTNSNTLFTTSDESAGFKLSQLPDFSPGTTFTSSLLLGGLDPGGNLHLNAEAYNFNFDTSIKHGPVDINTGDVYDGLEPIFDRFFKVTKEDIESLLVDLADGNLDNDVPQSLKEWPARNNEYFFDIFGVELPNDHPAGLAPFFDSNADGFYNPEFGDYPNIKGAESAAFFIYNFRGPTSNGPASTGLEVQVLARIHDNETQAINSSVFFDYKLYQTQLFELNDFIISMFVDPDLGCFTDDFMGYNPDCEFMYAYNQDATDGDVGCTCPAGVPTFCDNPPIMAYSFIKTPMIDIDEYARTSGFMAYNGSNPITSFPQTSTEYFNNMNNQWKDGTRITRGGTGYNPGSTDLAPFCYDGNPSNTDEWSMCNEPTAVVEQRGLLNLEPFDFPTGAVVEFTFAAFAEFVVDDYPCPDVEESIANVCDEIRQFEGSILTSIEDLPSNPKESCYLIENVNGREEVSFTITEPSIIDRVELFDNLGRKVTEIDISEQGRYSMDKPDVDGIYILRASGKNQHLCSIKVIVI